MHFGITSKLFLGLLGSSVVVALAMGFAMQASFQRGFLGYLNHQEVLRVDRLTPILAQAYSENGSWRFLRRNRGAWFNLLQAVTPMEPGEKGPPEEALTGLDMRLAVVDTHGRRVVGGYGALAADATLRPVEVRGQVVGYVALLPFEQASSAAAVQFQEQQLRSIWFIGLLSVLLAVLVAVILARLLLTPVRRIAHATRQLAAGDYSSRIELRTRDELGRLAKDFNHLALSLQRNEQLRRAFTADVSHELRTPLAVLQGELEAIQDGVRPLSQASLRSLQAEVTTLGKLINDLYDLSLSDVGALSYRKESLDLRQIVEDTLESFRERFAAQEITIDSRLGSVPLPVFADPDRLRQLFGNLLENALRYTDRPGRLTIGAHREQKSVVVDLQDSAPGVPEDLLSRLFERFYRAESSRNRASGGAGLGLAICRNIVEGHDGTIDARPSPLGGLWIRLRLPESRR